MATSTTENCPSIMSTEEEIPQSYTAADLLQRVASYIESCEYDLARTFCLRALDLEPENVHVLEMLGQVEAELGMFEEAVSRFQRAIQLEPNKGYSKYLYLGQLSTALESIAYYRRGVELLVEERSRMPESSEEALAHARKISSALCSMTEIYLTDCCFEPDAEQKCEEFLSQAASIDPENPEVYQLLASVRLSQCRNEEAQQAIEKSMDLWIQKEPGHPSIPQYDSRIALTKLLLEMSLHERAMTVLGGLQKENDQSVDLWYLYGWTYNCMMEEATDPEAKRELMDDMRECLENAIKLYHQLDHDDEPILEHCQELLSTLPPAEGNTAEEEEEDGAEDEDQWEDEEDDDAMEM
ncbi:uncharacterized protein VTP21DRAFT_9970 [Calcarisporiella thermophila]|uniref:uncharacterized protein n=1 Tax=Calcarisporiella thermophila TaxID=911321 RepID=UPI0037438BA0